MYALKLTPLAAMGLFVAHQAHDCKGSAQHRAGIDADRFFFAKEGEAGGLLRALDGGRVETISRETVEVLVENHVYEHLERALAAALEASPPIFGRREKQQPPIFGTEAEDAIKKAEKRDAPSKPVLVEKPEAKDGKKTKSA